MITILKKKPTRLASDFSAWRSDTDLEGIFWVTAIRHLHSTFITLSSFGLKAFSTTAPVEPGFENLCGSLGSSRLSPSCSLGFAPALPFTGNISFSSFLFLDSDHTLWISWIPLGWISHAPLALSQIPVFLFLIILIVLLWIHVCVWL